MKDFRKLVSEMTDLFKSDWALLTAGTIEKHNTMTIGWGGIGTLWGLPVATVYVRPSRYTHGFIENGDTFTVSFYAPEHKKALGLLGSRSGRDCDKIALAGLTPVPAGDSVTFKEAALTIVCKKIYAYDMETSKIPETVYAKNYTPGEPPHTLYIGEIVDVIA